MNYTLNYHFRISKHQTVLEVNRYLIVRDVLEIVISAKDKSMHSFVVSVPLFQVSGPFSGIGISLNQLFPNFMRAAS